MERYENILKAVNRGHQVGPGAVPVAIVTALDDGGYILRRTFQATEKGKRGNSAARHSAAARRASVVRAPEPRQGRRPRRDQDGAPGTCARTATAQGVNLGLFFGPTLLAELTDDVPEDFQPYPGYQSPDGKVAKATQEELLVWVHSDRKGLCWETQYKFRNAVKGHMNVARETIAWIYKNSLDLTGFIDGTGNPAPERPARPRHRARRPARAPAAASSSPSAGCTTSTYFNGLSHQDQENTFGRTKADSTRLEVQVPDVAPLPRRAARRQDRPTPAKPKRGEMVRRSTPYALHDGTVGLYFLGFCKTQAPLRERMEAIYGMNGQARDALTNYSTPASGSFYFAPVGRDPRRRAPLTSPYVRCVTEPGPSMSDLLGLVTHSASSTCSTCSASSTCSAWSRPPAGSRSQRVDR